MREREQSASKNNAEQWSALLLSITAIGSIEEENVIYRQILADPPVCVAAAAVPHTALIVFCMWCDSEGID